DCSKTYPNRSAAPGAARDLGGSLKRTSTMKSAPGMAPCFEKAHIPLRPIRSSAIDAQASPPRPDLSSGTPVSTPAPSAASSSTRAAQGWDLPIAHVSKPLLPSPLLPGSYLWRPCDTTMLSPPLPTPGLAPSRPARRHRQHGAHTYLFPSPLRSRACQAPSPW